MQASHFHSLHSGRVVISDYVGNHPVGLAFWGPFKLPIRTTVGGHREVWDVEHIEGHRFLLTINNFVTRAEGDNLWAYDHNIHQDVKGTKWIIERKDGVNHYTITDPEGKGWTLKDGENIVTLEDVPDTGVPDTQLWVFERE